jgi:hypothetical protein
MMIRLALLALLVSAHFINAHAEGVGELKSTSGNASVSILAADAKLKSALTLLARTKEGAEQLKQAEAMGIPIQAGPVSKTDITATRSNSGGTEEFKIQTRVTIAEDKEPVFQALDLAHELVHAIHPKSNPFDPKLNADIYVKHGIEGEGGEAEAIAQECTVGKELTEGNLASTMKADTINLVKARCQFVWNTSQNKSRWKQSFYFLGQYYHEFMRSVVSLKVNDKTKNDWADRVEARSPMFSSAVAHKPYPLALLQEYVDITHKVCNRAKASQIGRSISSVSLLTERCQAVGVDLAP